MGQNKKMSDESYPIKWNPLPESILEDLKSDFASGSLVFECVESNGVWMNKNILLDGPKIYNFPLRPDDVWIVTYPKCGTTWTQELLWLIMHNADFEGAKSYVYDRSPFLEFATLTTQDRKDKQMASKKTEEDKKKGEWTICNTIGYAENFKSPRLIKSHLPLFMLPPKLLDTCKVIYVCRNPKDCCVSYYHHSLLMENNYLKNGFGEFAKRFMKGHIEYGRYWTHLKDAWARKNHPNLKFLWYETMKKDLKPVIKELASFLDYKVTEEQVLQIDRFLEFSTYQKFRSEHPVKSEVAKKFFRKGKVGDWANYFTEEELKAWQEWIENNSSQLEGLNFIE